MGGFQVSQNNEFYYIYPFYESGLCSRVRFRRAACLPCSLIVEDKLGTAEIAGREREGSFGTYRREGSDVVLK